MMVAVKDVIIYKEEARVLQVNEYILLYNY